MPKKAKGLTALGVKSARPGAHGDGGGLYLIVSPTGARAWVFRYRMAGGRHNLGLGSADTFSLAEARERAVEARQSVAKGIDPIEAKRTGRAKAAVKEITFRECARVFAQMKQHEWKPSYVAKWSHKIVGPNFAPLLDLPVRAIELSHVLQVIEPIWVTKYTVAHQARMQIYQVLKWAKARGHRSGDNPARWAEHLEFLLPNHVHTTKHHPALPFLEIGEFMVELRASTHYCAAMLQFAILTASRNSEARGARWSEIDIDGRIWTIPPERMKGKKEHRVPLSEPALAVLARAAARGDDTRVDKLGRHLPGRPKPGGDIVFPSATTGRVLSPTAPHLVLRGLRPDITAHGFRSTFRDWAAEMTQFASEDAEQALAHTVGDVTVRSYRRGDVLEKRRALMDAWGAFCAAPYVAPAGEVVPLHRRVSGE